MARKKNDVLFTSFWQLNQCIRQTGWIHGEFSDFFTPHREFQRTTGIVWGAIVYMY